jgi:hypothetical protein
MGAEVNMQPKSASSGIQRTVALRRAFASTDPGARQQVMQQLISTCGDPDNVAAVPTLLHALAGRKEPEHLVVETLRALGLRRIAAVVDHHMDELLEAARARIEPTEDELTQLPELD